MSTLSVTEIDTALADLDGWSHAGDAIVKEFGFDGFTDAITFIDRVAEAAEAANHHPTILNVYNRVKLTLTSHDAGGVTSRDVDLARAIDALA
ncbi:MAG: 4a-hydroxytetrahydrobiopterin dehydratase [Nitriliruptoraceae bacterium]